MALKQIYGMVHQQGVVMAFADVFLMLTFLFVALAVMAMVVKRPVQASPTDAH
jgi:DHA2 family multidrug resistance protein